jgi:hypothetical protein
MTDFAGNQNPTIGPAGPFPDANVGQPVPTGFAFAPPAGSPYPPAPFDPVTATPTLVPWERVASFISAFGVQWDAPDTVTEDADGSNIAGITQLVNAQRPSNQDVPGFLSPDLQADWFEKWHVFPGELALGNVLSTQVQELELFNGFRTEARTWEAFVNNAGAGITATNLPSLPTDIESLSSFVLLISVSTLGPPNIDGTLDFDIDADPPNIIEVPITGARITIFPYRPQSPIRETLEFKTDIIEHNDGSEQRINVREAPRQLFKFQIRTDDDRTRDSINAVLYDWQSRVFGVPVWFEQKPLLGPLAITDTTVLVDTADADFRVGGLAMIYDGNFAQETLEIAAVNPGDIELDVGVGQAFDTIDTVVVPVRTALTKPTLQQQRFAIGPTDFTVEFTTLDNIDLSSAGAFASYMGAGQTIAKPLIDRLNFMTGPTLGEAITRKVIRLDTQTGPPAQFSPWAKGKPSMGYGFECKDFSDVWDYRQLMHFLRGSQLSFYVGTGRADFKPVADIADTSSQIDVQHFGFTQFVQEVTPRSDLQIHRLDGTTSQHEITGSSEVSSTVERITVSPGITPALPLSALDRIEFLTLCRISNDKPSFVHERPGEARLDMNLIGVPA